MLTLLPCLFVWIWVAMPFPVSDPYTDSPLPEWPHHKSGNSTAPGQDGKNDLPLDVNFYFFLFW